MGGRREDGQGQEEARVDAETAGADREGPAGDMEAAGTYLVADVREERVDEGGRRHPSRSDEERGEKDASQPDRGGGQGDPIDQTGPVHGPILSFYGLDQKGRRVMD